VNRGVPVVALLLATLACTLDDRRLTVSDAAEPPRGVLLVPDGQGFVDGSNAAGILGHWYVNSDLLDPASCLSVGFAVEQCSTIVTPPHEGYAFTPSDPKRLCMSGVAAKVIANPSTMEPDYDNIWGALLGLEFNSPELVVPNGGGVYDARAHAITGFSFVIESPPTAFRTTFSTVGAAKAAAYWGGRLSNTSPVRPGLNVVRWADVGGPMYLPNPPAFDETQLLGMQFTVISGATSPVPYDFCISELTALTE
jgi:hypothetical protein